jgi:phosphoribosylanthranilate isomerase
MAVEVKICGLSTPETLEGAIAAGADYVGLVFYPRSPRNLDLTTAARLAKTARGRAKIVTLVVDAPLTLIEDIAEAVRPDYFQAHGNEDAASVAAIHRATGIPVIKAIKVKDAADIEAARAFGEAAEMILFDAKAPEALADALPGGNGAAFDWTLLGKNRDARRFMLSGGLTPANVARAIAATGAPIVDVSSGVEISRGIKDLSLIRSFIEKARGARQ